MRETTLQVLTAMMLVLAATLTVAAEADNGECNEDECEDDCPCKAPEFPLTNLIISMGLLCTS